MIRRLWPLFLCTLVLALSAQTRAFEPPPVPVGEAIRFEPLDIIIDTGTTPLAAYQFELAVEKGDALIVGLEGGDHAAFKAAPYYDPAALQHNRIVVAAFSLNKELPSGAVRIARVHMQVSGAAEANYAAKLIVAADSKGDPIKATIKTAKPNPEIK